MPYDEMTIRALLAASAMKRLGFHGTADAFLVLARSSIFDVLKPERWIDDQTRSMARDTFPKDSRRPSARHLGTAVACPDRVVRVQS